MSKGSDVRGIDVNQGGSDCPRSADRGGDGEIRDLSDFCQQWQHLRRLVEAGDLEKSNLSGEQQEIVNWLRALADRVCKFEARSSFRDS